MAPLSSWGLPSRLSGTRSVRRFANSPESFGGAGKAYGRRQDWDEAKTVGAGGVGFRYLLARKLGLYAGLDVARGPEEGAIYLTAGSAWR